MTLGSTVVLRPMHPSNLALGVLGSIVDVWDVELPVSVRFLTFGVVIPFTAELEYGSRLAAARTHIGLLPLCASSEAVAAACLS